MFNDNYGFGLHSTSYGGYENEGGFLNADNGDTSTVAAYSGGRSNSSSVSSSLHMFPFNVLLIMKSYKCNPQISHCDFFGEQVTHVCLVGLVTKILEKDDDSLFLRFILDDTTGSIIVDWRIADYIDRESSISMWKQKRMHLIEVGIYVDLRGAVRFPIDPCYDEGFVGGAGGEPELPSIRAYNVNRVTVPEQIFTHQIYVAQQIVSKKFISTEGVVGIEQQKENRFVETPGAASAYDFYNPHQQLPTNSLSAGHNVAPTGPASISTGFNAAPSTPVAALAKRSYSSSSGEGGFGSRLPVGNYLNDNSGRTSRNNQNERLNEQLPEKQQIVLDIIRDCSDDYPQGLSEKIIRTCLKIQKHNFSEAEIRSYCQSLADQCKIYQSGGEKGNWKLSE